MADPMLLRTMPPQNSLWISTRKCLPSAMPAAAPDITKKAQVSLLEAGATFDPAKPLSRCATLPSSPPILVHVTGRRPAQRSTR